LAGARYDTPDLTDGRVVGEVRSRFGRNEWIQIVIELVYLLLVLLFCSFFLIWIGYCAGAPKIGPNNTPIEQSLPFGLLYPRDRHLVIWLSVALSGVVGGASFALKWLYHSVARDLWNHDRIVWRLVVPILSGVLAVFVGFMVASGILPFLSTTTFDHFYKSLGVGFFVGYFSDNVLARLQRLAVQWFGTASDKIKSADQ
jgi:hypothetical protein